MSLLNSKNLFIQFTDYLQNYCYINGGSLYLSSVNNFTLQNVIFDQNIAQINLGGAILSLGSNNILISKCQFKRGSAYKSGGISIKSALQNFIIQDSIFENNFSWSIAGAIDFETCIVQLFNTTFINNYAEEDGGAIHISKSEKAVFTNCYFYKNTALIGGALSSERGSILEINNTEFKDNNATEFAGAVHFQKMEQVIIDNSILNNNQALNFGGALQAYQVQQLTFKNSVIDENLVYYQKTMDSVAGGGYLENIKNLTFYNTRISRNKAIFKGGGVYLKNIENINIIDSQFENNYVQYDRKKDNSQKLFGYYISMGGAIYIETGQFDEDSQYLEETLNFNNVQFKNNSASSGSSILIYHQDELKLNIDIQNLQVQKDVVDVGLIRYLGQFNSQYQSKLNKFSNSQQNELKIYNESYVGNYIENEKKINEKSFFFDLCLAGTSSYEGGNTYCDQCDDHGICEGGYGKNYPKKEYWRRSIEVYDYIYCVNHPEQCLGQDECLKGYNGILCEECDYKNRFTRMSTGKCGKCPDTSTIIITVICVFFLYILLIYTTSSIIRTKVQKGILKKYLAQVFGKIISYNNQSSQITKIIIMHLQILYLIKPFYIEFPDFMEGISTGLTNPGVSMVLPSICIAPIYTEDKIEALRFTQSIISIIFSLMMWVSLIIFTILTYMKFNIKKMQMRKLKFQLVNISIVYFITQQVGQIQENMKFLACRRIGNFRYTIVDTHIDCDSNFYHSQILPFQIFSLLFQLVIIPGILFFIVYRYKKNIKSYYFQLKYGYLFLEFKQSMYYWEFITMLQKGLIVFLATFFVENFLLRSFFSSLVILCYSLLCLWFQPFKRLELNRLTQYSSLCQMITLFCSIIYFGIQNTGKLKFLEFLCVLIIFVTNTTYIVYAAILRIKYQETSLKVMIVDNYYKLPKCCIFNYLQKKKEKREKAQRHWSKVQQIIIKYMKIKREQKFKKFSNQLLIYNIRNEALIQDLRNNEFEALNTILYDQTEEAMLKNQKLNVEQLQSYIKINKILGQDFEQRLTYILKNNVFNDKSSQKLNKDSINFKKSYKNVQQLTDESQNFESIYKQLTNRMSQIPKHMNNSTANYTFQSHSNIDNMSDSSNINLSMLKSGSNLKKSLSARQRSILLNQKLYKSKSRFSNKFSSGNGLQEVQVFEKNYNNSSQDLVDVIQVQRDQLQLYSDNNLQIKEESFNSDNQRNIKNNNKSASSLGSINIGDENDNNIILDNLKINKKKSIIQQVQKSYNKDIKTLQGNDILQEIEELQSNRVRRNSEDNLRSMCNEENQLDNVQDMSFSKPGINQLQKNFDLQDQISVDFSQVDENIYNDIQSNNISPQNLRKYDSNQNLDLKSNQQSLSNIFLKHNFENDIQN